MLTFVIIPKVGRGILIIRNWVVRLFFFPRRDEYNVVILNKDPVEDILPGQTDGTKGAA